MLRVNVVILQAYKIMFQTKLQNVLAVTRRLGVSGRDVILTLSNNQYVERVSRAGLGGEVGLKQPRISVTA